MTDQSRIGEIIRESRKAKGLTLEQLARKVRISVASLHRVETGSSSPSLVLLPRLARAVDRPIVTLFRKSSEDVIHLKSEESEFMDTANLSFRIISPYGLMHPEVLMWHVKNKAGDTLYSSRQDGHEWAYILRGKMVLEHNDRIYGLNKGDTALCNQRKPYSVNFLEDSEYILAVKREKKNDVRRKAKKTVKGPNRIGDIIRAERQARGLTIAKLAKEIGIGAATLHRIETGSSSPSLDMLLRVAKKVDRPITTFFRKADKDFDFRENDEIELIETKNFSFKVIAPYGLIHPKIVIWHVQAKVGTDFEAQQDQGYDWAYMLKGKLIVDYGNKVYALNSGDMFFCDGRKPHVVKTIGDSEYIYACKKL